MMNNYERLSSLWQKLGLALDDRSQNKAEVRAYCAGIELIRKYFDDIFSQLFVETSSGVALSYYCEMLGVDGALPEEEKKRLIIERLNRKAGDYEHGELEKVVSAIDPGLRVVINDFVGFTTIYGSCKGNYDILPELAGLIENYIPPCTEVSFSGEGFDFDYWDSTPYLFEDFDNFRLPFYFIETVN